MVVDISTPVGLVFSDKGVVATAKGEKRLK